MMDKCLSPRMLCLVNWSGKGCISALPRGISRMPFRTSFQGTLKRGNLCIATRALRMLSKTS
uniref:Secreted protein n=1 Tax=Macrostomum lignano TaxID=282301 RepID=A0A1I8G8G4_9PLAT